MQTGGTGGTDGTDVSQFNHPWLAGDCSYPPPTLRCNRVASCANRLHASIAITASMSVVPTVIWARRDDNAPGKRDGEQRSDD